MSEGNGRLYEIQSTTCTPFCLKSPEGVILQKFEESGIPRKIERDDNQLIVTANPGQENLERKFFFPFGSQGLEIIYGRNPSNRGFRNNRF